MPAGTARRTSIARLLAAAAADQPVTLTGWIKTSRFSKNVVFVEVFDGSSPATIQVVLDADALDPDLRSQLDAGASVRCTGVWVPSLGEGQAWEVRGESVAVIGRCEDYALQPKKRHTFEHLRTIAHLRPRTNTQQSVLRVRNALSWQIHRFFQERGFLWIHTPIITGSDAEGAGELFQLSTLDGDKEKFFGGPAFLTVSGQLQVECMAQSHTDVYTFGPTFRAENSNTPRHAAEFWMIEPEMAFCDLQGDADLAEAFIKHLITTVLERCPEDMRFFDERIEKGIIERMRHVAEASFERMPYGEAVARLEQSGQKFEYPVYFGANLQAEHERYLTETLIGRPVFVTDYPREIKAFYMRRNDDGRTVAAMDLLVPKVGELIGGSQREERLDVLVQTIRDNGLPLHEYEWYLDTRRYGTAPHAGFGLGFERMVMYATGMQNIRDVIPFPRTPGSCTF